MLKSILRSETIKFFSYNWCVCGTLVAIFIAPLLLFFSGMGNGEMLSANDALSLSLRAFFFGQVGLVIAGAGFFGQEYTHSYLRTTFLTVPARMKLVVLKLVILGMVALGAGILSGLLCLMIGLLQYHWAVSLGITFMTRVIIAMISWVQMTWITAAITMLLQSQIVAIGILFSLILSVSQILFTLTKFAKYLPDLAAMNLFLTQPGNGLLNVWSGVGVQIIWVVSLCSAALIVVKYRDIR